MRGAFLSRGTQEKNPARLICGAELFVRNKTKLRAAKSAASLETNAIGNLAAQGADEQSEIASERSVVDQREGITKRSSSHEPPHEGGGGCGNQ